MRRPAAALAVLAAMQLAAGSAGAATSRQLGPSRDEPFLILADEIQQDQELGLVVAKGHVELSQKDQSLLADVVTYNQKSDLVTASGHVSLLEPTGEVLFGDYMELHDNFREGFIQNVRGLLSDRSRVAANTARRIEGNITELRRAVYSPCDLCADNPSAAPLWQIKSERMVHDKEQQRIEYYDVMMEVGGFPVLYSPYFAQPDPTVKRMSGFLAPDVGSSSSIGAFFRIPYYFVLSGDKDMTLEPIVTTEAGAVLSGQYRQRWGDGQLHVDASGAYTNRTDDATGNVISPIDAFRWHFLSQGEFNINDNWRTIFDIQRSSDQTYMRRFNFGGAESFLQSRAYAQGFDDRGYTLFDSYAFQSLRLGVGDSTQPIVLPTATYNWISHPDTWGGRWSVTGNVLNLFRSNGTQIRRASAGAGWSVPFDGAIGDRFTFSASLRGDGYNSDDLVQTPGQPAVSGVTAGRFYPQTKLEWHYPWVRYGNGYSQTIEPIAAVVASPNGNNPTTIPFEDSAGFEFDESSLFVANRFPGYDRVDSGQRVDYGINASLYGDGGGSTRFLIGQSYRFQSNGAFGAGTGLNKKLSDVVGRLAISPAKYLDLIYRFRLDPHNLTSRRQEVTATGGPPSLRLSFGFIDIPQDPLVTDLQERRQITGSAVAEITRYWSAALFGTRDIGSSTKSLNSGIALTYRDECLTFMGALTHTGTRDRDVRPGTTLLFSIIFKNLGEIAVTPYSTGTGVTVPTF